MIKSKKIYRSQRILSISRSSHTVKLVEIEESKDNLIIYIYYLNEFNQEIRLVKLPKIIITNEGCKDLDSSCAFLLRQGIEIDSWKVVNEPYFSECNIHFSNFQKEYLKDIYGVELSELLNKKESSIEKFAEIECFGEQAVELKMHFYDPEQTSPKLIKYYSSGQFVLLTNNNKEVVGCILVSEIDNFILFIEKTGFLNCLIIDPKKQKRIAQGRIIFLSLSDGTNRKRFIEKIESMNNKTILVN